MARRSGQRGPAGGLYGLGLGGIDDGAVQRLQRRAQAGRQAGTLQGGVDLGQIDRHRRAGAPRPAQQPGQRRMLIGLQPRQPERRRQRSLWQGREALAKPQTQRGQRRAAQQALQARVGHAGSAGSRRSGSGTRCLARPSQVQRDTNTASTPSRRCSWQMATPGSSA